MKELCIDIHCLSKEFLHGEKALNNINLSISQGAIFGIIGKSGAGKSTLMRCLIGLEKPSQGSINFPTGKNFGMIFQHFHLFSARTALENVIFPLEIKGVSKKLALKRGEDLLELVGLGAKKNIYPLKLSGGEKQRLAIARALAPEPSILFSDESTSALDPTTKSSILTLLSDLNKSMGLTIVLITHEMEVIREICTDIAVLEKGEVVEQGKVEDVFSQPKHLITKRFLYSLLHEDIPAHLFDSLNKDRELLRLYFRGNLAREPIISRLIKGFDIEVNILLGGLDKLSSTIVGNLLVSIEGSLGEREKAKFFLKEQGIHFEMVLP